MQSNEPYIGSVRFFKNIIFLCCILSVLIPTGLALRWRSRAKTAESLLAQNAVVLTSEEDEAASEAEAASAETEPETDRSDEQEPLSYQLLYPDFYAPTPLPDIEDAGKTIYLTFDDGPSDRTDEVLKILDEKGVKATFFVIGREDETSIQRIKKAAAAGHTIGMHSYSHDYEKIYASVEDFLDDFYKLFVILRDEAGVTPRCSVSRAAASTTTIRASTRRSSRRCFAAASATTTGTFRQRTRPKSRPRPAPSWRASPPIRPRRSMESC